MFLGSIVLTSQWLLVLVYVTSEFHRFLLEPSMGKSKFRFAGNHHNHSIVSVIKGGPNLFICALVRFLKRVFRQEKFNRFL